ncbi:unnamed protein product [Parascedosporium putredinis]|uniref:TeaA receptor TeaR n=1 Tax=Parascedosporium putredinis TaxID=1442378 RepID=A0A9P1H003_9PEZI|nr:unnamed protein product [Parascedosporium putredinis]CAI7991306.1 unnamed protein product [Parascedosporium putredinis]
MPKSSKPRQKRLHRVAADKKNAYAIDSSTNSGHPYGSHHGALDDYVPRMANGDVGSRKPTTNGNAYPDELMQDGPAVSTSQTSTNADLAKSNGTPPAADSHMDRPSARRTVSSSAADRRKPGDGETKEDDSKWIHRDKLAIIESQELQAAGIILPRHRMPSRARRAHDGSGPGRASDASLDRAGTSRSRANSISDHRPTEIEIPEWDLRLPDEVIAEANKGFMTPTGLGKGATRIPVAKLSPAPIPVDYLERDSPSARKASGDELGKNGDSISHCCACEAIRDGRLTQKGSGPTRRPSGRAASTGRPKTRSGPNKDSTSSAGTRPSTRSGDFSTATRQPEGDPPWLVSAYQPDPRLPPDQQLLPTVARRLQQERWEKEGKFGNVYDKEFRPLTDDGFLQPPEKREVESKQGEPEPDHTAEWPLRDDVSRSQTPKPTLNSYSTMPKISDKPPQLSPLPSPRTPGMSSHHQPLSPMEMSSRHDQQSQHQEQEKQKTGGGCGCCIVM